jgi:hypothetical protein
VKLSAQEHEKSNRKLELLELQFYLEMIDYKMNIEPLGRSSFYSSGEKNGAWDIHS